MSDGKPPYRGEVEERLVMMPMQIKLQREGDRIVALMPAYLLPLGLIAEGADVPGAIAALESVMRKHWRGE